MTRVNLYCREIVTPYMYLSDAFGMPQNAIEPGSQPVSKMPQSFREGNEQFIALCQKAEEYMDSCVLAETSEHYGDALGYCQQAIDHLKYAMRMQNLSQSLYITAQKKSNSCVIKFRSLQKRLMSRQESNTSCNSSDSGINQDYRSRSGHYGQQKSQTNGSKPPSRSSSQNSMDSISSSGRSATPVFDKVMRPSTSERVPPVEPHMPPEYNTGYKDRSFETNIPDTNANNADLYGTLPRRKTQKSQDHVRQCNNQKHEAEVYNDFLENQRRQNGNHSRSNSGARTPVNDLNPSSYQNFSYPPGQFMSDSSNSDVNRNIGDQSMGVNYGQGTKPIPVVPPKIGNQSQHTEVCNQSRQNGLPVSTRDPVWFMSASQTTSSEHGYHSYKSNAIYNNNGEFFKNPPVVRTGLYGTLPCHVRSDKKPASKPVASFTSVHTAYSTQLPVKSVNLCEPVASAVQYGSTGGYRSKEKSRQLDRSASFSHPSRPSEYKITQSRADENKFSSKRGLANSKSSGTSQPDLRKLCDESVSVPQRPLTPQVLCSDTSEGEGHQPVSVRALTSRFESATVSNDSTRTDGQAAPGVQNIHNNQHLQLGPVNSVPGDSREVSRIPLHRQRSKSESESLAEQPARPKSALAKKCKNSDRLNKPRKSVTFSADICLVSAAENGNHTTLSSGYHSDDKLSSQISCRKGSEETDSSSSNSPVEVIGEGACTLCHKLGVEMGSNYCAKCTFYMNRFTPR